MTEPLENLLGHLTATPTAWSEVVAECLAHRVDPRLVVSRAIERQASPEVVLEGFRRAQTWDKETDAPPAFTEFSQTAPGLIDMRVFDQDEYWVDALRAPHRITDRDRFTDEYLVNVIAFLRHDAEHFLEGYCRAFPARTVPADPTYWLERTRLWRALQEERDRRDITNKENDR